MITYLYTMCFIPVISALLITMEYKFSSLSKYRIMTILLPFISFLMSIALLVNLSLSPAIEWKLPGTQIIPDSLILEPNVIFSLFAVIYLFFSIISLLKSLHQKPNLKILQMLMIPAALILILTNSVLVLLIMSIVITIIQTAYFSNKKDSHTLSVWLSALLGELILFTAILLLLSQSHFPLLFGILLITYLIIKSGLAPFGFRAQNHFSLTPPDFFISQTGGLIITIVIALKLVNIHCEWQEAGVIIGSIFLLLSVLSLLYQEKIQDIISHIITCQAGIIFIMIFGEFYSAAIQYFISVIIGMTLLNIALYLPSQKDENTFSIPKNIFMISGILISIGIIPAVGFPALNQIITVLVFSSSDYLLLLLPAVLIPAVLLIIAYKLFSVFFKEIKSDVSIQQQNEPPVLNTALFFLLTFTGLYIFYQIPFYDPIASISRIPEYFGNDAAARFSLNQYLVTGSVFTGLVLIIAGLAWFFNSKKQKVTLENLPDNPFTRFFYHDLYFDKVMDKGTDYLKLAARQMIIVEDKIPGYLVFVSDKFISGLKQVYSTFHRLGQKVQTYINKLKSKIKINTNITDKIKFEQIVSIIIILFILILLITIL